MNDALSGGEELAREGRWDELAELIDSQPDLATRMDAAGRTLLVACARFAGSAATLTKLVTLGADPNHRAFDGSTALAAAIVGGSRHGLTTLPEVKSLLELGADPEQVADGGMPALHWAIAQHRPEHARVLLDHGARSDALTQDDPPETAEDVARRVGSTASLSLLASRQSGSK